MGSTQRGTVYPVVKTHKVGSRAADSAHKGAEVSNAAPPHRGHGHSVTSSHRSGATSPSSPYRKSDAVPLTTSNYPRPLSPQAGPAASRPSSPRGTDTRCKAEAPCQTPLLKRQQISSSPPLHRNISPPKEETARRYVSPARPEDSFRSSISTDAKAARRLSFLDKKDNFDILQEKEAPSKVQNPQGVRVPRKRSVYPKDVAVQTEFIRKPLPTAEARSPQRLSGSEYIRGRTVQKRIPTQEHESSLNSSVFSEAKAAQRNVNLESSLKLSVVRDMGGGPRVPVCTEPRPVQKPSAHVELELIPRPLPPRSLPRYDPDSSWWALLNPETEMPQSQPTTPVFELKSPYAPDSLLSFFERDSDSFCEDLMYRREKASPSPPTISRREVPQTHKHLSIQPIERFSAFFLDISDGIYGRALWWLKGKAPSHL
ncbi:PREDICTED: uncharacterized protein C17orf47 homolog [Elephantulus edwardii]|uniref:uncharacterized protein C17orf47 homolog n=1 Tax=Elephantulus edwardii TaxID=28737 RepID=UPI0003F0B68A|nr:PREDICTED: uncharacterized protein C17orf47 homolog [Elephantulus edwardii]